MANVINRVKDLKFTLDQIPTLDPPRDVLMVHPQYFTVKYVINPHMAQNVGTVDQIDAETEWKVLKKLFEQVGLKVHVRDAEPGLPDLVFCANQSLPYLTEDGQKHVIMSVMFSDERKDEVPFIEQWYRQQGYDIHHLDTRNIRSFEGCGDAIWHPRKRLLWGGYDFRTSQDAYEEVSELFDVPVLTLKLNDEKFYHLDTCFCTLNEDTVLIYPGAFTQEGLDLINAVFTHVIHASQYEAEKLFACNACCPDGRNVIIQQGCTDVNKKLRDQGFAIHEVSTYEFLKSGGSVFCMKQLVWG